MLAPLKLPGSFLFPTNLCVVVFAFALVSDVNLAFTCDVFVLVHCLSFAFAFSLRSLDYMYISEFYISSVGGLGGIPFAFGALGFLEQWGIDGS